MKKISRWFTLVELIVVITILAILWTIWFVSFSWYAESARDSTRISDMSTIWKSLELFKLREWFYPSPSNSFDITYSWSLAWSQGVFWEETRQLTQRISVIPVDPLTKNEYTYSVSNTGQEYELWSITEKLVSFSEYVPITKTYANNSYFSYVTWNYNKEIVSVRQWDTLYILGVPTLIISEINSVDIESLLSNQGFSILWTNNLPSSYAWVLPRNQSHTWTIVFWWSSSTPILFQGDITELNDDRVKWIFWENLFSYYENTGFSNNVSSLPTTDILRHVNSLIVNKTGWLPWDIITVNDIWNNSPYYLVSNFVSTWDTLWTNFITILIWDVSTWYDIYFENINNPEILWQALWLNSSVTVNFPIPWEYLVRIRWDFPWLFYNNNSEADKITSVIQWWEVNWKSWERAFYGSSNLESVPNNTIGLESVTNMRAMFRSANSLSSELSAWDVSNVENMSEMFRSASSFTSNLSQWDVSNVQEMSFMFRWVLWFTSDLSQWDVSNVRSMTQMFRDNNIFESDLSSWGVWQVQNMWQMFRNAHVFNSNLSSWDVGLVWDVTTNYDFDFDSSWLLNIHYPIW